MLYRDLLNKTKTNLRHPKNHIIVVMHTGI